MGYIKHYAVIVVGWDEDKVRHFHLATQEIRTSVLARHVMPVNVGGEMLVQVGTRHAWRHQRLRLVLHSARRQQARLGTRHREQRIPARGHGGSGPRRQRRRGGGGLLRGDDAAEVFDMRTTAHPDWLKFPEPTP